MSPEWECSVRVTRVFSIEWVCEEEFLGAMKVCMCCFSVEKLLWASPMLGLCFGVSMYVWTLESTDQVNPQGKVEGHFLPPSPQPQHIRSLQYSLMKRQGSQAIQTQPSWR